MYALDTMWNDETCPIRKCHCQRSSIVGGNIDDPSTSVAHTVCQTQCPHIAPSTLNTMPECLQPRIVEPEADTCACPFVTCDPLYDEMTVNDLSFRIASPTAAEISFSLPDTLLAFLSSNAASKTSLRQQNRTATPFFAAKNAHDPVAAAEPIKSLHLVVAETHPNNGSIRHMHRLDLPYDSLLKERTSFTETPDATVAVNQRPKTTVVVRYVLQNLDPTMLYSVKARLVLRDGVALPFSNTINITTAALNSVPAQFPNFVSTKAQQLRTTTTTTLGPPPPPLSRTPLRPLSTLTTRPYYSTAAIKLVQQRKTVLTTSTASSSIITNCHVPVRGVIETFNDGDAVMRNCTHLCRCLLGAVECRYMCWTREYAMQMLRCNNVVPTTASAAQDGLVEQPQLECCVHWRCQEGIVVINDGELPAPSPPSQTTTAPRSCHSPDGQAVYHIGQTWRNHCNAMCLCATNGHVECDDYNPFCADLEPLFEGNYQQCSRIVEHFTSCCPAYNCNEHAGAQMNVLNTAISPGLLITLHILSVDIRPGTGVPDGNRSSINHNSVDWWHTTARVRWNIAQDLIRQGAVVELVWRPLTSNSGGVASQLDNEITTPNLKTNTMTVVEAHGEAEVLIDKQKMWRSPVPTSSSSLSNDKPQVMPTAARRNAHAAYELVLKATLPSTESNAMVKSNYVLFSLPLVLDDPILTVPSSIVARGTATTNEAVDQLLVVLQTTTNRPTYSTTSTTNPELMKDFLFNTTGNGFPLGFLILIIICVGILLCMLCVGCIRCVLVRRRRGGAGGGRVSDLGSSKTSSTASHIFQHGTVAAYAPTTNQLASKYDTTTANLGLNRFDTVSQRPAAAQTSANHPQFYLKHSPHESSDLDADNGIYGAINTTIGSTVGSRLAALNHDRHRNGFTVVASSAALPVPLVAAPINGGNDKKTKQKTENKTTSKTKKKQQNKPLPHTAGVYSVAPQTITTTTASMSSAMTTPNTSIPDLRSSLVYNKYASFDNLVFTGK